MFTIFVFGSNNYILKYNSLKQNKQMNKIKNFTKLLIVSHVENVIEEIIFMRNKLLKNSIQNLFCSNSKEKRKLCKLVYVPFRCDSCNKCLRIGFPYDIFSLIFGKYLIFRQFQSLRIGFEFEHV